MDDSAYKEELIRMAKEMHEKDRRIKENFLLQYSTSQLKKELLRRKLNG